MLKITNKTLYNLIKPIAAIGVLVFLCNVFVINKTNETKENSLVLVRKTENKSQM